MLPPARDCGGLEKREDSPPGPAGEDGAAPGEPSTRRR